MHFLPNKDFLSFFQNLTFFLGNCIKGELSLFDTPYCLWSDKVLNNYHYLVKFGLPDFHQAADCS